MFTYCTYFLIAVAFVELAQSVSMNGNGTVVAVCAVTNSTLEKSIFLSITISVESDTDGDYINIFTCIFCSMLHVCLF